MKPLDREVNIQRYKSKGIYKVINELKDRAIYSIAVLIISFALGLMFSKEIISKFIEKFPFDNVAFFQTSLTEAWLSSFKIGILTSFIVSFPFILFHIIKFNKSILTYKRQKNLFVSIGIGYLVFFAMILISYSHLISFFSFLLYGFGADIKMAAISLNLSNYVNFCLQSILTVSFMFSFPLVIMYGARTGVFTQNNLKKLFKFIFMIILLFSFIIAFINPLFKFFIYSVIALIFYFIGLFICKIFEE